MISKNSSFSKKALFIKLLRREAWIGIAAGIGFVISILLMVFSSLHFINDFNNQTAFNNEIDYHSNLFWYFKDLLNYTTVLNPELITVLIALAIVGAAVSFYHLHSPRQMDFYGSLPIKRGILFALNYAVVPALVLPIYILVDLIGIIICISNDAAVLISVTSVIIGLLENGLYFLFVYSVMVFAMEFTGNTLVSFLFSAWLYFSPTLFGMIGIGYFESLMKTFYSPNGLMEKFISLSPLGGYYQFSSKLDNTYYNFDLQRMDYNAAKELITNGIVENSIPTLITVGLVFVVITIINWIIYCKRPVESAKNTLAFQRGKRFIRIYMTLFVSAAGGLFLMSSVVNGLPWMIGGMILFGIIMHFVVDIIYAQDVHNIKLKHPVELVATLAISISLGCIVFFDLIGYDTKIVMAEDMSGVNIGIYNIGTYNGYEDSNVETLLFTEPEDLQMIENFMSEAAATVKKIKKEDMYSGDDEDYVNAYLMVKTLNGSKIQRQYMMSSSELRSIAENITHLPEYVMAHHTLFKYNDQPDFLDHIRNVTIGCNTSNQTEMITGHENVIRVWEAMQRDYISATIDEFKATLPDRYIMINYLEMPIYPFYAETNEVLENMGIEIDTDNEIIDPQSVDMITLYFPDEENTDGSYFYRDTNDVDVTVWRTNNTMEAHVTDANDIALLLENAGSGKAMEQNNTYGYGKLPSTKVEMIITFKDGTEIEGYAYEVGEEPTDILDKYEKNAKESNFR